MARPRITDERRLQIIESAAAVIAERGVCDARVADIAGRIGISAALVLYYFPSKDALLVETITHQDRQFYEGVVAAIDGVETAADRLRLLVALSVPPPDTADTADREWVLWLDLWARSRRDAVLAAARERFDALYRDLVAGIVAAGVATGEFRTVDPDQFAVHLTALLDGLAIQVLLRDPIVTAGTMREVCLDFIERELLLPARSGG